MGFLSLLKRKKPPSEAERRARLLETGRIVDGLILDVTRDFPDPSSQVFYSYSIHGVEYESCQLLNEEQQLRHAYYSPGASVTVRYDPRHPVNSIVV